MLVWLRRRGWLIPVCGLLVLLLASALASVRPARYTAEAVLVVPSGAGTEGPGSAFEATTLAVSYAEVIPRDADVLRRAAELADMSEQQVRDGLAVSVIDETGLLRIRYTADTAEAAADGASGVANAVLSGPRTEDTFPRGSVTLSSLPTADTIERTGVGQVRPIGLLLGLVLGVVLAVAWDRSDRRVDTVEQLGDLAGVPASPSAAITSSAAAVMARRWTGVCDRPVVALVPAVPGAAAVSERVADDLAAALRSSGTEVTVLAPPAPDDRSGIVLLQAGALGAEQGESALLAADVVALVVPAGTPQVRVARAVEELQRLGAVVDWAFLAADQPAPEAVRVAQ